MALRLKPLKDQVIFITGASSGIGLMTARIAAARKARVFLVSRSEEALRESVKQIQEEGGEASFAVADVASIDELKNAAEQAVQKYGRIDTWVNNAGASIYGRIAETNLDDDKRLFETNFWGVMNGSRLALGHLKNGGAIINTGSVVSEQSIPLQGMYSASKHAVLGFTDALRMEVENAGLPIAVTLIKPSAINTPYPHHAKNYMEREPSLPPPVYEPEVVSEQILYAATHPVRELYAGGGGWAMAKMGKIAPRLMDWYMEKTQFAPQQSDEPSRGGDSLNRPAHDAQAHGDLYGKRMIRKHSLFGVVSRHPMMTLALIGAAGAVGAACALMPHDREDRRYSNGVFDRRNLRRYGRFAANALASARLPRAMRSLLR